MNIIPVIDLKSGHAVLAKQGDRTTYQPLSTPLCQSSQLDNVIDAYLSIYSFKQIYIADLDALMGHGHNQSLINLTAAHYPQINFIVDRGYVKKYLPTSNIIPIIGTESTDEQELVQIKKDIPNFILSLDFCAKNNQMGDHRLYTSSTLWPQLIIIMTLHFVGKNSGPDLTKLQHYYQSYPKHQFIAAGGIRHQYDLTQLKKIGIQHVLIASALHNKMLQASDIHNFTLST